MTVEIGTIFYSTWGYEQTNIDYYEVVKSTPKTVTVRMIAQDAVENDMRGTCTPCPGHFIGEPIRRKVQRYCDEPSLKIKSYAYAYPWDGKPKSFTTYG